MEQLPVYLLNLETRLKVDGIFFEDDTVINSELEKQAFPEFRSTLEQKLELYEDILKDTDHSLELLMLERDVTAITHIIEEKEAILSLNSGFAAPYDDNIEIKFAIYDMALRYRYALGLNDSDESFESYYIRKTEHFRDYATLFNPKYTLPSLIFPYEHEPDTSKRCYVGDLVNYLEKLSSKDERYKTVFRNIYWLLQKTSLPTKQDWTVYKIEEKFSYMEQYAIQAEIIMDIKNQLRDAILYNDELGINTNIDSLYVIYHHNLLSSGINVDIDLLKLPKSDFVDANFINTGILGFGQYDIVQKYANDVRIVGNRGHGYAAEKANHLIDKSLLKDARIEGDDNRVNGPDRVVDGEYIQTKYHKTGGKSIGDCFKNGKFRYIIDGKPMQIEVPKDQYESALQSMRDRIKRGDMEDLGIVDPIEAEKIVRKGHIKYKTAQRIAKAGTIEGISYDAAQGAVTGLQAMGISTTFSFAQSIWRGEDTDEALGNALKDGSSIFGKHIMQHIATKQIGRTAVEKSLRPTTDYVVKNVIGSKNSAQIINTFFRNSSQSSIYGVAAMNNLSKIMRGNMVVLAVSTVVLSSGSILDAINGKISKSQLFKNVGTTGGTAGGAAIGATLGSVIPVAGSVIGGVIGGIIGGKVSQKVLDTIIDDDSIYTMEILKDNFMKNIEELQLDRDEINYLVEKIFDADNLPRRLKDIYAASSSKEYIENWLDPFIHAVLKARPRVGSISNRVHPQQETFLSENLDEEENAVYGVVGMKFSIDSKGNRIYL